MKQVSGQMTLDACKNKKRLIYSISLTCRKTICPYCKADNPEDQPNAQYGVCPFCKNEYNESDLEIKKSKDYEECERLGLKGAVYKDEKGIWRSRNV